MMCGLCNGSYVARFLQIDTAATATNTATSAGYDDLLGEPNVYHSDPDDPIGEVGRVNTIHDVQCQVDVTQFSDRLRQSAQGKSRDSKYEITVQRRTLQNLSLIDPNGESMIRTGAQLDRILDRSGSLVLAFPNPPGLFVEEIIYDSWVDPTFALAVFVCTPRDRAL